VPLIVPLPLVYILQRMGVARGDPGRASAPPPALLRKDRTDHAGPCVPPLRRCFGDPHGGCRSTVVRVRGFRGSRGRAWAQPPPRMDRRPGPSGPYRCGRRPPRYPRSSACRRGGGLVALRWWPLSPRRASRRGGRSNEAGRAPHRGSPAGPPNPRRQRTSSPGLSRCGQRPGSQASPERSGGGHSAPPPLTMSFPGRGGCSSHVNVAWSLGTGGERR
jgi:hypothetical protein